MMKNLRTFAGNDRGTAVIELAVALPVMMMLALGITDFVTAFGQKMAMQQQAQAGANFIAAHYFSTPTEAEVKEELVATSGLTPSQITVTKWTECNQSKTASYGECPGESDVKVSYMQVTITDTYDPMLDIEGIADFVGQTNLNASVIVRLPS